MSLRTTDLDTTVSNCSLAFVPSLVYKQLEDRDGLIPNARQKNREGTHKYLLGTPLGCTHTHTP